jgi:hypothetical protein
VVGFFWSGTDDRVRHEYYHETATQLAIDGTTLSPFDTNTTPTKNVAAALTSTTNQSSVTVSIDV